MDGGHKSVATGLASYRSLRHHHNVETMQHSRVVHGPAPLASCTRPTGGWARLHRATAGSRSSRSRPRSTTTPSRRQFALPPEARVGVDGAATAWPSWRVEGASTGSRPASARQIFHSVKAPHRMTSVQAGEVEAVHELTTEKVCASRAGPVEGQTDILTMGLPYICPYNVNSIMNPILVVCLGPRVLLQPLPGQAAGARGRGAHHEPPHAVGVPPGPPPELHRLLRAGAGRDDRPGRDREPSTRRRFATDPWYIHLYRTGHAYHGVHPFYMWYWCAHALQHLGAVIIVGGDAAGRAPPGLHAGVDPGRRAGDGRGRRSGTLAHHHPPARPADPHGGRAVTPARRRPTRCASAGRVLADAAPGDRDRRRSAPAAALRRRCARRRWPPGSGWPASRWPPRAGPSRCPGPPPSPSWASTTTPSGRAATRPGWPGRWCSTT